MNRNDFEQKPSVEAKFALTEPTTTLSSADVIPTADTTVTHGQQQDNSKAIIESIKVNSNCYPH